MEKRKPIPMTGDPYILKDGRDYYLVPTCKDPRLKTRVFQCYHSVDLTNWSEPVTILDLEDVSWAKEKAWAPTMAKWKGKYYLAFCAEQQIGIAVSDSPMGKFRDILNRPLIAYNQYGFQTIDPCLYAEGDHIYLFWGEGQCNLVELALSPTTAAFLEEPVCISDHFYYQTSCTKKFDITVYNEAADIIKIKDRYLLSWSIYDVKDPRYCVRYAWADNIYGPYIQPVDENGNVDNILLKGYGKTQCTGHACITEYEGEYFIFYGRYMMPRRGYQREIVRSRVIFGNEDRVCAVLD